MKKTWKCFLSERGRVEDTGKEEKKSMEKGQEGEKNKEYRKKVLVLRRDTSPFDTGRGEVLMVVKMPYLKNY